MRRHPRAALLAAWFDGEGMDDVVAGHIVGCDRCRHRLEDLGRVRAAVRGELVAPMLAGPAPPHASGLRPALAGMTMLIVVAATVGVAGWRTSGSGPSQTVAADQGGDPPISAPAAAPPAGPVQDSPPSSAPVTHPSGSGSGSGSGAVAGRSRGSGAPAAAGANLSPATTHAPAPSSSGGAAPAGDPIQPAAGEAAAADDTLVLGVPVVPGDPSVDGAHDMQAAAQQVVAAANAGGGVAGRPVVLKVVDPTKPIEGVDALVGGSGLSSGASVPWLLPADPTATGKDTVRAEPAADVAGATLGAELRDHERVRAVGVIVGDGPDAALRDGLATALPVVAVPARPHTDCDREIAELAVRAPAALAIAGPPALVAACLTAAAGIGWRPAGGVVVPPSLAYANFDPTWAGLSVRTLLGLPGPMGTDPGATRFRASTGFTSYKALVTFAATELAVAVARSSGSVTAAAVSKGTWYTDLLHYDGTDNHGLAIAHASAVGWQR